MQCVIVFNAKAVMCNHSDHFQLEKIARIFHIHYFHLSRLPNKWYFVNDLLELVVFNHCFFFLRGSKIQLRVSLLIGFIRITKPYI